MESGEQNNSQMHKYRIFKLFSPKRSTLKGDKNKMIANDLEPPPDDRHNGLFWPGNIDGRIGDSLLYRRWAPFAYPVGSIKLVHDSPRILHNRKNSYLDKLVSYFKLFSWFGVWMLYSDNGFKQ